MKDYSVALTPTRRPPNSENPVIPKDSVNNLFPIHIPETKIKQTFEYNKLNTVDRRCGHGGAYMPTANNVYV